MRSLEAGGSRATLAAVSERGLEARQILVEPREDVFQMGWAPPAGTTQAALGAALAKRYGIRSEALLTSCSTCHR